MFEGIFGDLHGECARASLASTTVSNRVDAFTLGLVAYRRYRPDLDEETLNSENAHA